MVNVHAYLDYALTLKSEEEALRQRFLSFLPSDIVDCHAHSNLPEHVTGLDKEVTGHMMSSFPYFTIEQSQQLQRLLYPGKSVRTLRFANAYRGINHRAANEYLLENSPAEDRVALYGIPDDIDYTILMLDQPRVTGLKMYYQYFNPPATSILQVFPSEVLEHAQRRDVPIILHLPRMITNSLGDLEGVLQAFPRLKVILAHMGLPHLPVPGLMAAYEQIAEFANVYMDTSMIPSEEVMFMGLKAFGPSRIMFGTDQPLNLIRSKVYHHPTKGERLITEFPYHWVDQEDHATYQHLAIDVTHTHWQVLNAIQKAVSQLPLRVQTRAVEAIFYGTAHDVFGF